MGLKFLHPHIQTIINDNSAVIEEAVNTSSVMFQPYMSDMGECGRIIKYTSLNDFITKNGNPNFRVHGQPIYNIVNWLNAGGVVYGYRITDTDATYANLVINVKTKKTTLDAVQGPDEEEEVGRDENRIQTILGGDLKTKLDTKLEIKNTDVTEKANLSTILEDNSLFPEEEDYTNHPLFAFYVKGKGEYGNDYSIELKSNYSQQSRYSFKVYDLTLKRRDSRGQLKTVEGPYLVSLHPGCVSDTGNSMFIKDIVDNYSEHIAVSFNQENYYSLMEVIKEFNPTKKVTQYVDGENVEVDEVMTTEEIDFLFWRGTEKGKELNNLNTYLPYSFVNEIVNEFSLDGQNGEFLAGGSEGAFAMSSRTVERTAAINKKYADVFSGVEVPEITNKKYYPFEVVLDANYSSDVKQSIYSLVSNRQDFIAILDTGFQPSVSKAIEYKREYLNFNDPFCALFCQTFSVTDRYTTMEIPVTMTYFLASLLPKHDSQYGIQFPFAGPSRGIVTGFKSNTLNFNPDDDQQEELYTEQLNYIVQDPDGTEIGTNLTSQSTTSALSNINNVRVLIKLVKQIEERARFYRHEFADSTTLSSFASSLSIVETEWVNNRACTSLSIQPYQTDYDLELKTCRVSVDITFNGTIERIVIEVNVG